MNSVWICVISLAGWAGRQQDCNTTLMMDIMCKLLGHILKNIPDKVICTINLYHFMSLSVSLILTETVKVRGKPDLLLC